ncbi:MAG: radical SAM protein [Leptospiraceae bacterium]|nr:radical SAM protein [Leptospiraceae bacterium]MCB1322536.1 radical SAM protein [Leptospiraceae bacterium]
MERSHHSSRHPTLPARASGKPMTMDFANILFAGPCNRACPFCIGEQLPGHVNVNNLNLWPPRNLDAFIERIRDGRIRQVIFTGTVSDPQLYAHEARLLTYMRERLPEATQYSVHTNGVLALRKMDVFNLYDRACISFPSFQSEVYAAVMGHPRVPDLKTILQRSQIPVKVSCVVTAANRAGLPAFLDECRRIGVRRLVLRKLFGEHGTEGHLLDLEPKGFFHKNPVYDWDGMEVTDWNFDVSAMRSINLFADGTIGTEYLLTDNFPQASENRTQATIGGA